VLEAVDAEQLVTRLWPEWLQNREHSKEWERWALGKQDLPAIPETATHEYKELQKKSVTPWLGLVVESLAQALVVEGYRATGGDDDHRLWQVWQANKMDRKQCGLYEAALTTGISYLAVLKSEMPGHRSVPKLEDVAVPEWRPYSSAEMSAFYERTYDEWPVYALAAEPAPRWLQQQEAQDRWHVTLLDDEAVYVFTMTSNQPVLDDIRPHGAGVCPVVAFVNRQKLTGRAFGEVERYTPVAARIDQDVFDRLVTQRFSSWRVRTATGLVVPEAQGATEEEKAEAEKKLRIRLAQDDVLAAGANVQFGSLPETPLDGHLRAPVEDVRMLAAVSQTPPTHLTGDLSNIAAEALAAFEAAHNRKAEQRKMSFGESHEQAFDLTGRLMKIEVDPAAQVRWRDMESRSMAQTADAFGKLAQMLGVPVEILWDKLPMLTDQDRERARELRAQGDGFGQLLRELQNGQTSPPQAGPEQVPSTTAV
jgi:SPP1 Gp6-like portal protein